ncbi:hypothetical protein [Maritimibacter sp. DP1N21-5]|uniref:hypothetical protein n=1 Tax=Maritimibacter sp. DP1N21-5 TaxID=2836867 RepID=UPI001C47ECE9|nr:hypothetical protein [Maritimibacter sp. DP1N21-5]MBV7407586.1 hypothetical protein [Maritimibacter sp. DP1N21-5]
MTNNVIELAAHRAAVKAATTDAPAKVIHSENNVISIFEWKAQGHQRKSAAIMSTTDVLAFGGYAA